MTGDEFVTPSVITDDGSTPRAVVANGDSVIFYNYRGDRPREITKAFVMADFTGFDRGQKLDLYLRHHDRLRAGPAGACGVSQAAEDDQHLGEYVSNLASSSSAAPRPKSSRTSLSSSTTTAKNPSPAKIARSSPRPSSAQWPAAQHLRPDARDERVWRLRRSRQADRLAAMYDLVVVNFANGDMVGHTGVLAAAIKAVEIVDECVGKVLDAIATPRRRRRSSWPTTATANK